MSAKDGHQVTAPNALTDDSSDAEDDNLAALQAKIEAKKRELAEQRDRDAKASAELQLKVQQSMKAMDDIMSSAREIHDGHAISHAAPDLHVPSPPSNGAASAAAPLAPSADTSLRSPATSETSHHHTGHSHHHRTKSAPVAEHQSKDKKEKKDKKDKKVKEKKSQPHSHHLQHHSSSSSTSSPTPTPTTSSSSIAAPASVTSPFALSSPGQSGTSSSPSAAASVPVTSGAAALASVSSSAPASPVKPISYVASAPRSPFTNSRPRSNSNTSNASPTAATPAPRAHVQRRLTLEDSTAPRDASPSRDSMGGATFKCPDANRVREMIRILFGRDIRRAWLLMGYSDADTIVLQGSGVGPLSELLEKLDDTKVQYILVRVPTTKPQVGSLHMTGSKDLCVTWTGPRVGMMEKARKQIHHGGMSLMLKPSHADIHADERSLFSGENLLYCAEPHGGHQLSYDAKQLAQYANAREPSVLFDSEYEATTADLAALQSAQAVPQNFTAPPLSRNSSGGVPRQGSPFRRPASPARNSSSPSSVVELKPSGLASSTAISSNSSSPTDSKLTAAQKARKNRGAILSALNGSASPSPPILEGSSYSTPPSASSPFTSSPATESPTAGSPAPTISLSSSPLHLPDDSSKLATPTLAITPAGRAGSLPSVELTPTSSSSVSTESSPANPSPLSVSLPARQLNSGQIDENKARRLASLQRVKFDHLQEEAKKLREQRLQLEKAKKELELQTNTEEWRRLEERAREQARLEEVLYEAFKQQALRKKEEERQAALQQQLDGANRSASPPAAKTTEQPTQSVSAPLSPPPGPRSARAGGSSIHRPENSGNASSRHSPVSARPKTMAFSGGLSLATSTPLSAYEYREAEAQAFDEELRRIREEEQNKQRQKIEEIRKAQEQKKQTQIFTLRKPEKIEHK